MSRRRFNRGEKNALYMAAGGDCAACGTALPAGWHADHVAPFSRGGATSIVNGQALCPGCNIKKGSAMTARTSGFVPRPHQEKLFQAVELAISSGRRFIMCNVFPGSGKTNGALFGAHIALREGAADTVVYLSPRVNLCRQIEDACEDLREMLDGDFDVVLSHRENTPPLFRQKVLADGRRVRENGYATTYASLMADPKIHADALAGRRYVLILDEAQQLGADEDRATKSTKVVEQLVAGAALTISMSGTVRRSDGQALLGGTYGEPNDDGMRPLLAEVDATYQDGVAHLYLRPFDFVLVDGYAEYTHIDRNRQMEHLFLGTMDRGIRKVVWHEGYWQPLIDQTVETVRDAQTVDPRFCGLVAAGTQQHARDTLAYLGRKHPGVKALIAVSDERLAQDNLRQFQKGGYDILITVQMAYIGYDHPWITVVCCLNDIRWYGFLDQLLARGLRVVRDVPVEQQTLRAILPADPAMQAYAIRLRGESEDGIRGRDRTKTPRDPRECEPDDERCRQESLGYTTFSEATERMVRGLAPSGDLEPEQFDFVADVRKRYRMTGPLSEIARFMRDHGVEFGSGPAREQAQPSGSGPRVGAQEMEKCFRGELNKRFKGFDQQLIEAGHPGAKFGFTAWNWKAHNNNRGLTESSLDDLERAQRWLDDVWGPFVRGAASRV